MRATRRRTSGAAARTFARAPSCCRRARRSARRSSGSWPRSPTTHPPGPPRRGPRSWVREVLQELGGELKLWRIGMRPGAPVGFGLLRGVPWIGLPGNPVSTMVTFELFVRPAIRRLQGHALPFRRTVPVIVREPITLGPKLRHYLRAIVEEGQARLTGPQGSGILTSMARANALLIVPAELQTVLVGTALQAT